jgi:enoyl-[acyl-carrier protein] reductase II
MGTEITGYLSNHSIRSLKNKATEKYIELEKSNAPYEQLHELRAGKSKSAPLEGDVEWGLIQAGQSLSVITSIKSCEEIINDFIKEAKEAIENLISVVQ